MTRVSMYGAVNRNLSTGSLTAAAGPYMVSRWWSCWLADILAIGPESEHEKKSTKDVAPLSHPGD